MNFLFDFFPILLFFIAFKFYGIYVATATAIGASCLQVGWFWLKHRRFEMTHLLTLAIIVIFGGTTLFLHNEIFIKWKPTAINWALAAAFLGSQFIGKKPLIKRMMEKTVVLPQRIWHCLNTSWSIFFIVMGAVNLYVVYHYSTDVWVNFKLFGMLGMTFLFAMGQALFLSKYMDSGSEENGS